MSLPPAGWYDDPTDAAMQRWWDGDKWTEHRRQGVRATAGGGGAARPGELRDVGDMMGHAFSLIRQRIGGIIGVGVVAAAAIGVAYGVLIVAILGAAFEFDGNEFNNVDGGTVALLILTFIVAGLLAIAALLATTTMLWDAAVGRSRSWGASFVNGFRRLFPYLGWMIVGSLPMFGLVLLIAAVAGGRENTAFGLILLLIFVPLMYWSVVLYFLPVVVIRDAGENAVLAAFELVKGRWWRIFGRMLAWGLILIGIGIVAGIVFGILSAFIGSDGGPVGATLALIASVVGLVSFFLYYALQVAPTVSITYDLAGTDGQAGDPMA